MMTGIFACGATLCIIIGIFKTVHRTIAKSTKASVPLEDDYDDDDDDDDDDDATTIIRKKIRPIRSTQQSTSKL